MINLINKEPPLKGYQGWAFVNSMLFTDQAENYKEWLLNHCINIYMQHDFSAFQYCNKDWMYIGEGVLSYSCINLPKDILNDNINVLKLIKNMILNGWNIILNLNQKYLRNKRNYQLEDYDHDNMIFGFDDEQFFLIGYDIRSQYSVTTATYNELLQSIVNVATDNVILNFVRRNTLFEQSININKHIQEIGNYLNSYDQNYIDDTCYIGVKAQKYFLKYIKNRLTDEDKRLDPRYIYFFWEHKNLFLLRIKYYTDKKILEEDVIFKEYQTLVNESKNLINVALKQNMLNTNDTLNRIYKRYVYLTCKEEELLKILLSKLKTYASHHID